MDSFVQSHSLILTLELLDKVILILIYGLGHWREANKVLGWPGRYYPNDQGPQAVEFKACEKINTIKPYN